jgi:hypothetical protein
MKGDLLQKRTRTDRASPVPQTVVSSQKRKPASSVDANIVVTDDETKELNSAGNLLKKNRVQCANDENSLENVPKRKESGISLDASLETCIVASQTILRDGTKTGTCHVFYT